MRSAGLSNQTIEQGTVIFYENLLGDQTQLELEKLLNAMNLIPLPFYSDRMRWTLAHQNREEFKRKKLKVLSFFVSLKIHFLKLTICWDCQLRITIKRGTSA